MRDYSNSEIANIIDEHIHSDRDRLILKLRLIDGWTYERIACDKRIEMSPKRISYIVSVCCARIEKYLQ